MASTAQNYDICHISGPKPGQQLRTGGWVPVEDASADQVKKRLETLDPFMQPQAEDTPQQKQIKVGLRAAKTFLIQHKYNVSEAMTYFFQDARAFFKAMSPDDDGDSPHQYGIIVGFFAGLFFCTRQGMVMVHSLLEKCLHEALETTKKVLAWLQNEELEQTQALSQKRRGHVQGG
jgi:hypothetical protein